MILDQVFIFLPTLRFLWETVRNIINVHNMTPKNEADKRWCEINPICAFMFICLFTWAVTCADVNTVRL